MIRHYTAEHEWIVVDGEIATVGITDHAQKALGDLVFVSLPTQRQRVSKGAAVAVVESVKSASDVFAPMTGTVVETNQAVISEPGLINSDPLGLGWLFRLHMDTREELASFLTEEQYEATLR